MIIDKTLEIADAVALNTGGAGTYLIGDQIDLSLVSQDIGNGQPLFLILTVDTAVTGGGTVNFKLVSDAAAAIATDGSATEHWVSDNFSNSDLAAGRVIVVPLPAGFPLYERYLGLLQVTAVAAVTAGKINAFVTRDPAVWRAYADAAN